MTVNIPVMMNYYCFYLSITYLQKFFSISPMNDYSENYNYWIHPSLIPLINLPL
jgi:hypothetical protein